MGNSIPDEGPITTLYQEMYGRMIAYASSVLGDRSLAEEAVQDTFCIFCVKAETTLQHENPQGWLMRTLQNVMRNMQRHRAAASRLIMQSLQTERLEELLVYDEKDVERILNTEGMIRSVRKVNAMIHNARCYQKVREEFGTFCDYLWAYSDGKTILYQGHDTGRIPVSNGLSDRISKDLKKRGFQYIGPVTIYSHLQACGIINDHQESCFRYPQLLEITDAVRKRRDKE